MNNNYMYHDSFTPFRQIVTYNSIPNERLILCTELKNKIKTKTEKLMRCTFKS